MPRDLIRLLPVVPCLLICMAAHARAQTLNTVFPAGGQAGKSVIVTVEGTGLEGLHDIHMASPGFSAKKLDGNRFELRIPESAPVGVYDLRAVGSNGMSSPRAFCVSDRTETVDAEPNDAVDAAQEVPLDSVVNGRIEKPGDVDCFRFKAKAGQRVVLECRVERIDSKLRAVLEVFDAGGKRLAANRGYAGIDPLVDFRAPTDGDYVAKVFDLSYLGSSAHFYRLEIDTRPRVEFVHPCVVQRGKATKVKLYGRNLSPENTSSTLDSVDVSITPPSGENPLRLRPSQIAVDHFAYHHPGSAFPVMISVTDAPVILAAPDHHTADHAQDLSIPCEIGGQLLGGEEQHWYAIRAQKGEVIWLEVFGARMNAPVDLSLAVLDSQKELGAYAGTLENLGGYRFPTAHSDLAGKWVAPADGRYLIQLRNVIGGLNRDERRVYRLSLRREEPDFRLAILSRRLDQPAGLNIPPGGHAVMDVLAFRQRGLSGPIRISAENLPPGIQCPDAWIGPGQDRAVIVLSAARDCPRFAGGLTLVGHAESITRPVRGGTMIWPGLPLPSGRLTQEIPLATTTTAAALLATATPNEAGLDQEGVLDVAINVEQQIEGTTGPIQLSVIGLPRDVGHVRGTIPSGETKGWISIPFPASLPPGRYTFAVQVETTLTGSKGAKTAVSVVSNPITIQLRPARIVLEIDPSTPTKIARGKTIQIRYTAERRHGFIGKIHTELMAPGGVVGLRGRGVTFVGQADSGSIQVVASEDAPLGRHPFLRLEAVGTVEDQPVYRAGKFVELEITE